MSTIYLTNESCPSSVLCLTITGLDAFQALANSPEIKTGSLSEFADSMGGQPTLAAMICMLQLARARGTSSLIQDVAELDIRLFVYADGTAVGSFFDGPWKGRRVAFAPKPQKWSWYLHVPKDLPDAKDLEFAGLPQLMEHLEASGKPEPES